MCQELILKYNNVRDELLENDVKLVMVSLGLPEKGKELISHLELTNGDEYLFVDPENALYDNLQLNSGVGSMITMATSFSFLDRFTTKGGMDVLLNVLSKWKDAIYIPPKQSQAFNQGGTFVFNGPTTNFAHYDESTAAHANVIDVMKIAINESKKQSKNSFTPELTAS